jgi:hypothetical protein
MVDWLINDDGIRVPHVGSEPSSPTAGSTQIYANSMGVYSKDSSGVVSLLGDSGMRVAIVRHIEPSGTDAPGMANGAWRTRPLNDTIDPDGIVLNLDLLNNRFTLGSGKYFIRASAPAYNVYYHQTALYNHTTGSYVAYGQNVRVQTDLQNTSVASAIFAIASDTIFELHHRCSTSNTTNGMGRRCNFAVHEVYAVIEIVRITT